MHITEFLSYNRHNLEIVEKKAIHRNLDHYIVFCWFHNFRNDCISFVIILYCVYDSAFM